MRSCNAKGARSQLGTAAAAAAQGEQHPIPAAAAGCAPGNGLSPCPPPHRQRTSLHGCPPLPLHSRIITCTHTDTDAAPDSEASCLRPHSSQQIIMLILILRLAAKAYRKGYLPWPLSHTVLLLLIMMSAKGTEGQPTSGAAATSSSSGRRKQPSPPGS